MEIKRASERRILSSAIEPPNKNWLWLKTENDSITLNEYVNGKWTPISTATEVPSTPTSTTLPDQTSRIMLLSAKLSALEKTVRDNYQSLLEKINGEVDLSDYYTKEEVENLVSFAAPTIGGAGTWIIDGEDTGVSAVAQDGYTPDIRINDAGYWCIDGVSTGVKAKGEDGTVDIEGIDGVRVMASAQVNDRAAWSKGFYATVQYNPNVGYGANVPKLIGDVFESWGSANINNRNGSDWVKVKVSVKAGDEFDIWGEARPVQKTVYSNYWICMPLFWVCNNQNEILYSYPLSYLESAENKELFPNIPVMPKNTTDSQAPSGDGYPCTFSKDNPYHFVAEEDGYLYFNAYVDDALDNPTTTVEVQKTDEEGNPVYDNQGNPVMEQIQVPAQSESAIEEAAEPLFGVVRRFNMTAGLTESGSLALSSISGYTDDYTDEDYFYNDNVPFIERQQRAANCRRFLQDAIDFTSTIGTQLVFPKNKVFVIHIDKPLVLPANFTLDLNGCTIQAFTHSFTHSAVVNVPYNSPNVTIKNGCIYGDRLTHDWSTSGSHEYNFAITPSATGFHAQNLKIGYVTGDGLYICGDVCWNHLKTVHSSTFVRGIISTKMTSDGHYDNEAGTVLSDSYSDLAYVTTPQLKIDDYKSTYPVKQRLTCAVVPRPITRIPDLDYKVGMEYICAYYQLVGNEYRFISAQTRRWGDQLNIPNDATHFRMSFEMDRSKTITTMGFDMWICLVQPVYGVHIDNCEILFCGRNGICPTAIRKCVIDKCVIHDIWGTNNCVGIDFENTSYIDRDCIVRDTRMYRCGRAYDPTAAPGAPNGGCIIFSQGAHYVVDNCDIDGSISGGNEDVHIINTICNSIGLSPRGGVNVTEVRNTVDNCRVRGHIYLYNGLVRNCISKAARSNGKMLSVFENCKITNTVGHGIFRGCEICTPETGSGFDFRDSSNTECIFDGCTIYTKGWTSGTAVLDITNSTIYHSKKEIADGPFNGYFRKFQNNTMYFDNAVGHEPWIFYAAADGLIFTNNRLIYKNNSLPIYPIRINLTSAERPSAIKDNFFEGFWPTKPGTGTDFIMVTLGSQNLYFYDNVLSSQYAISKDIAVTSTNGGKVYRKNSMWTSADTPISTSGVANTNIEDL